MEYVTLNNGIKMPKLGYGVYQPVPDDDRIPPLSVSLLWLLPHNTAAPSDML